MVAAARALRAPSDRPIYLPPYERLSVTKASSDVDEAPDTDRTEYELSSCPACSSPDLAVDATAGVTLCEGCGSIITQAGIDALATSEHPEPTGPLDELP